MTLAAIMAISMVACTDSDDKDDDKDTSEKSSVVDSSEKDADSSSEEDKDSSSEEDKDSSSEEEPDSSSEADTDSSSEDDSSKTDVPDVPDKSITDGTLRDGNLYMTVDSDWTTLDNAGNLFYVPSDYTSYGNNLNIITSVKDPFFSSYTKDIFEQQLASQFGEGFSIDTFDRVNVADKDALRISYTYSGIALTQVMIDADDASIILTFTGNEGSFADIDKYIDTITLG